MDVNRPYETLAFLDNHAEVLSIAVLLLFIVYFYHCYDVTWREEIVNY